MQGVVGRMDHESFEEAYGRLKDALWLTAEALRVGIAVAGAMFTAARLAVDDERRSPVISKFERQDHRSAWACCVRAAAGEALRDAGATVECRANEGIALITEDGSQLFVLRPDLKGQLPAAASETRSRWYEANGQMTLDLRLNGVEPADSRNGVTFKHLVVLWDHDDDLGLRMWLAAPKNDDGDCFWHEEVDVFGLDQSAEPPSDGGDIDLGDRDDRDATGTEGQ